MEITKNGFYELSKITDDFIIIKDNLRIIIYDEGTNSKTIEIGTNSKLELNGFLLNKKDYNLEIIINGENSSLNLGYLLLAGNKQETKVRIFNKINASNIKTKLKLISIAGNNGKIDLDGILDITKGIYGIKGELIEENLFIGDNGIINSIPSLLVKSNDVKACHSCKIERINDEKLFYLRSKGISRELSINMILESYINVLFKNLTLISIDYYESVIININKKINNYFLKNKKGV